MPLLFPIFFLFQFLSLFSCAVVFEFPGSVLHLWWKLIKNVKELTEATKVLKEHVSFFSRNQTLFFNLLLCVF